METPSLVESIYKLALAGEQAGFSVETMIQLLSAGLGIGQLIALIDWKLNHPATPADRPSASRWIM